MLINLFNVRPKVHYMPGKTPLVGWIKGYMVPELLGIEVGNKSVVKQNISNMVSGLSRASGAAAS